MLILSRKQDEEIVIGDNVRLIVLAVHGNQVRLGFTAPPDVSILRKELCKKAMDQATAAACPAASEAEP